MDEQNVSKGTGARLTRILDELYEVKKIGDLYSRYTILLSLEDEIRYKMSPKEEDKIDKIKSTFASIFNNPSRRARNYFPMAADGLMKYEQLLRDIMHANNMLEPERKELRAKR